MTWRRNSGCSIADPVCSGLDAEGVSSGQGGTHFCTYDYMGMGVKSKYFDDGSVGQIDECGSTKMTAGDDCTNENSESSLFADRTRFPNYYGLDSRCLESDLRVFQSVDEFQSYQKSSPKPEPQINLRCL